VKNIAAINSAAGSMMKATADSEPVEAATKVKIKPPKLNDRCQRKGDRDEAQ